MLYLVDGYNVTKGDPVTRTYSLERQRNALVDRLRVRGRDLLGPGRIVIVFDGASGVGDSHARSGSIEIRFARSGTADDAIVNIATAAKEKVVLISADTMLRQRVNAHAPHGSESRGREVIFDQAQPSRAKRSGQRYPSSTVGLPKGANRITEELKGLWLDEGE